MAGLLKNNLLPFRRPRLVTERGMTLLEVMVALAVFAVAGLAVMNSASLGMNSLSRLQESTFATWVASNVLAEVKLQGKWPSASWVKGKEDLAEQTWYWQWRGVATEDKSFMAIEVEVRSNEKSESPVTTMRTYVGK